MKDFIKKIIREETSKVINEATMEKFPLYTDKFNIGWDNTGMGRHRDQSLPGMVDSKGEKYLLSKTHALHNSDYNGDTHTGIDIFAVKGTKAYAPVTGEIVLLGNHGSYGGEGITIHRKSDNMFFRLVHMDELAPTLNKGDTINAGDYFGTVGDSGNAKGKHPHIHFSVHGPATKYTNDVYHQDVDPCPYLQGFGFDVQCDRGKTVHADEGNPEFEPDIDYDFVDELIDMNKEIEKRKKEEEKDDSEEVDISVDDEIEDITGPIDRNPPIKVDKVEDLPDPTTVPNLYAWVGKDKYEKNRKGDKWVKVEEEDLYD
jgi:murein DD-endopeptidase MepM/ murein hydrolase activator NlpD